MALLWSAFTVAAWGQNIAIAGPGLDPATLTQTLAKPATDSWHTYAGDHSQRRFSPLTQINRANVHELTLAWKSQALTAGPGTPAGAAALAGAARAIPPHRTRTPTPDETPATKI